MSNFQFPGSASLIGDLGNRHLQSGTKLANPICLLNCLFAFQIFLLFPHLLILWWEGSDPADRVILAAISWHELLFMRDSCEATNPSLGMVDV
jgi:hypothetical protein